MAATTIEANSATQALGYRTTLGYLPPALTRAPRDAWCAAHHADPDRALAALRRRPALVALLHDDEVLPEGAFEPEPHDVAVDAAATPSGWRVLG